MIWAKNHSALKDLVAYRYLLLLMGLFAFYNGWIYNDFSSLTFNVFGSCYTFDVNTSFLNIYRTQLLVVMICMHEETVIACILLDLTQCSIVFYFQVLTYFLVANNNLTF